MLATMELRVMLAGIRDHEYRHKSGRNQPAQQHLGEVRRELPRILPVGMRVLTSGSGQSLPVVPWIAVLDPDVTKTAQEGLYVVYLYRRDLLRLYLSMNQGTTQHLRNAEKKGLKGVTAQNAALNELAKESALLREGLSNSALAGLVDKIDLDAKGYFLPRGYELGNVAAIEYDLTQLPDDSELSSDLTRLLGLYANCVEIKQEILATQPGLIHTSAGAANDVPNSTLKPPVFRPNSSADYTAHIREQVQRKSRRHEKLVEEFATWVKQSKLTPANKHTGRRDLTVDGNGQHWLIEAKIVGANAELVVREAIGQLFTYRQAYYRDRKKPDPGLVALFSEPIGLYFAELLVSLGIEVIWHAGTNWQGFAPTADTCLFHALSGI